MDMQTASTATTSDSVGDLAHLHWKFKANEKLYAANMITTHMYNFARDSLLRDIANLEKLCYVISHKDGVGNGFIKNQTTA